MWCAGCSEEAAQCHFVESCTSGSCLSVACQGAARDVPEHDLPSAFVFRPLTKEEPQRHFQPASLRQACSEA